MEAVAEKVLHEISILDETGDTKIIWNPDDAEEAANAKATFDRFKKKNYLIYRVDGEHGKGAVMHEFDPTAKKMIISPPIIGG